MNFVPNFMFILYIIQRVYDVSPQPFRRGRFAIGPVCRGRFAASRLISVFRGTNGNLISTIQIHPVIVLKKFSHYLQINSTN
jgi:hypothetical protein